MSVVVMEFLVVFLLYDLFFKGSILFFFYDSYLDLLDMYKIKKLKRVYVYVY